MLAVIVKFILGHLVVALMLSIGLTTRSSGLAQIRRRWWFYLRAVLLFELAVPMLAMAVVSGFELSHLATGLILLLAICPGAPFLPKATRGEGERYSAVGLDLLVLVSLLAPLTIPIWLGILDRLYPFDLSIEPAAVFMRVLETVLLPLAIGAAIRVVLPSRATTLARIANYFFLAALAIGAVVAIYLGAPVFLDVAPVVPLAIMLITVGSALMGYWIAAPDPDDRRVVATAAALGNPGLALAIVSASYPGFKAAAFVAAYVLFRKLVMLTIAYWT